MNESGGSRDIDGKASLTQIKHGLYCRPNKQCAWAEMLQMAYKALCVLSVLIPTWTAQMLWLFHYCDSFQLILDATEAINIKKLWYLGSTKVFTLWFFFLHWKHLRFALKCPKILVLCKSIQVLSGPGLRVKSQGLNWEWAGQKPAADQNTQWNYSINIFYLVHKETKSFFFFCSFMMGWASPTLLIMEQMNPNLTPGFTFMWTR